MQINVKKTTCIRIGPRHDFKIADIVINGNAISCSQELKYLGVVIVANKIFKCDPHSAKVKFFRSLNGVLGKIGTCTDINVSLSLVSSFCTPVLLYGFDTGALSKSQVDKLAYPFCSIYYKLFNTFDKQTIVQCQFYTGQLPLKYLLHVRFLSFLKGLKNVPFSPANLLFEWFGKAERQSIAESYGIVSNDSPSAIRRKIWNVFEHEINAA
jgi:hypothetical protein